MKANLLIVEQHKPHAERIYRDIHMLFDHCHMATTVKEAELLITEHTFNIIIVNPFLADGNGRLFIRNLKTNKLLQYTPVVVLSELPAQHVKLDFYSYGADAYIEMPYNKEKFLETIRQELLIHYKLVSNKGNDEITLFTSRKRFEEEFIANQLKIRDMGENGIIGLLAPAGIDFIIKDLGIEIANKVMASLSNLMRKMCSKELQASMWTQKSIVFTVMNKMEETLHKSLHELRNEFLDQFKDIPKLQKTPGLRVVLMTIPVEKPLVEIMPQLSNQLVQISQNFKADPVQFYGANMAVKRHVMIADPDPVAVNVVSHRLKKDGFEPTVFHRATELETHPSKGDIAAILIDSMVPGGGVGMVRQIRRQSDLNDTPLVVFSRYGFEEEISEVFKAGAQDYMMKPISMIELSARVKRLTG